MSVVHGRHTFEQSDVMLIRKGKRKEVINTHIQVIVRECCVIMGGRNNKLKEQKGLDQKGSGRQRNPPKEILPWVKRTISKAYGWTKIYIRKIKHTSSKQE